jgi:formate dehydrogenase
MALDERERGIWKSGRGRGRATPKGRQLDEAALAEVLALIGPAPHRRDLLIEYLHRIQDAHGHLAARHLRALAELLRLSMAEVWEVATFYAHFDPVREDQAPPPALTIRVCDSLSCELAGAAALKAALEAGTDPSQVRIRRAPCMGRCDTAPVAEVGHRHVDHATPDSVLAVLASGDHDPVIPDYEGLAAYRAGGGYEKLAELRQGGDWQAVQATVAASGLRGLGGAGFPAARKWGFVRAHPGPRYLAVNGDEGEPGTFKDRWVLERTPHLMLEGMLIAAWAVEAVRCFIYMRDEYPAVRHILATEIAALEAAEIVAPGYIELRRGAGA